jgi:site-specific recombinase XerD
MHRCLACEAPRSPFTFPRSHLREMLVNCSLILRARSGYITDREVSKQWLEAKRLAGVPESVVLYCARHRFSTDAMEGTGNVMAVMDAMGHGSVNTTRIYTHSNVQQIREAIERRNQLSTKPVEAVQKLATKVATVV